jgi:hypothetical protein
MARLSVVVFEESPGRPAEPFIATRDPEVVRLVRKMISDRLQTNPPAAETRTSKSSQELK